MKKSSQKTVEDNLQKDKEVLTEAAATNNTQNLAKQTIKEFLKSILVGIFPVALDLLVSSLIFYLFFAKSQGISFFRLLFASGLNIPAKITVIGTAVGYGVAAVLAYLLAVFFVFDNRKQGRTVKGIVLFILVEGFAYGFNILLGWLFNLFIPSLFAYVLRICVSYIVVFLLRKFLIFMPKKDKQTT